MSHNHLCTNCQQWSKMSDADARTLVRTGEVTVACPACGVVQVKRLLPAVASPPPPPAKAPWDFGGASTAPTADAARSAPLPFHVRRGRSGPPDPVADPEPPADPAAELRTAKPSLAARFDALPKPVQYAAILVPFLGVGVGLMAAFSPSGPPPRRPAPAAAPAPAATPTPVPAVPSPSPVPTPATPAKSNPFAAPGDQP